MTSPRDPLANAAAELGSLVDSLRTRAKDALGDPAARVELSRQAETVAATAAAAASTVLSGLATAAQTVGSVLDGWAETHRSASDADAGAQPADAPEPSSLTATGEPVRAAGNAATGTANGTANGTASDVADGASDEDEGVAWD